LEECPKLRLIGTDVTDDGLAALQSLHTLKDVDLTGTKVSGAGIGTLAPLKLTSLNVSHTPVSDSDLEALGTLSCLSSLDVSGTYITEAGRTRLSALLPDCTIVSLTD
jgi:hypothetical protein